MSYVFDPFQLGSHLFLFLLVLMVFFIFVDTVLFKLLLDLINLLIEKPSNIRLLFDQYLWGFILDGCNIVDNFFMKFIDLLHSVPIWVIKATLGSK